MVHEGTIIFVNPELLKTDDSFKALKEYLSINTLKPYTKIKKFVKGKISTELLDFSFGEYPGTVGYLTVLDGYCCMTVEVLKSLVGIED